jgi:hypothetical protein
MHSAMGKLAGICIVIGLLLASPTVAAAGSLSQPACPPGLPPSAPDRSPESVLLVPLLKGSPEENEPESWPKRPAAQLANFYRSRFGAKAAQLSGIRTWDDFFAEAERLRKQGAAFDRIILIGHGGLDGPVLNDALIVEDRSERGSEGRAARILEAQPGLADALTIKYDASRNPAFAAALARRWKELAREEPDEASRILVELEAKLEPPDSACLAYHCPAPVLNAIRDPADRESKRRACAWVCRRPLYEMRWEERVDAGRFSRFANSLSALAEPEALIVLGSCSPGTRIPGTADPWVIGGRLARSGMAGGPHETYLHLLAAATVRPVAGPVGQASADEIVEQVRRFETGRLPPGFRLVMPPAGCRREY